MNRERARRWPAREAGFTKPAPMHFHSARDLPANFPTGIRRGVDVRVSRASADCFQHLFELPRRDALRARADRSPTATAGSRSSPAGARRDSPARRSSRTCGS